MVKVGLLGKKYLDEIIHSKKIVLGDTNKIFSYTSQKGGIYNFLLNPLHNIQYHLFPEGEKKAIIVSESSTSQRTSFTFDLTQDTIDLNLIKEVNWLHISYIDDINVPSRLLKYNESPFSLDFCTLDDRLPFKSLINKASLVFDSRERKHLYNKITSTTPIILHDPEGCECIINDKIIYKSKIIPIKNIHPNGAGDIFAGIFIKNFLDKGLEQAISISSTQTKNYLQNKV